MHHVILAKGARITACGVQMRHNKCGHFYTGDWRLFTYSGTYEDFVATRIHAHGCRKQQRLGPWFRHGAARSD